MRGAVFHILMKRILIRKVTYRSNAAHVPTTLLQQRPPLHTTKAVRSHRLMQLSCAELGHGLLACESRSLELH